MHCVLGGEAKCKYIIGFRRIRRPLCMGTYTSSLKAHSASTWRCKCSKNQGRALRFKRKAKTLLIRRRPFCWASCSASPACPRKFGLKMLPKNWHATSCFKEHARKNMNTCYCFAHPPRTFLPSTLLSKPCLPWMLPKSWHATHVVRNMRNK